MIYTFIYLILSLNTICSQNEKYQHKVIAILFIYIYLSYLLSQILLNKDIVVVPLSWGITLPESEASLPTAPGFLLALYTALADAP